MFDHLKIRFNFASLKSLLLGAWLDIHALIADYDTAGEVEPPLRLVQSVLHSAALGVGGTVVAGDDAGRVLFLKARWGDAP